MRTGVSLTLFTIGAVLGLAVHVDTSVININLIGLILMLVAVIGFALSPAALSIQRRTTIKRPTADGGSIETTETSEQESGETFEPARWSPRSVADDAGNRPGQANASRNPRRVA